jgi:hypothetical protein
MLKISDERGTYAQQSGFHRPYRLRLYRDPTGHVVVVVTAEPFTTWLVRLGPAVAPALGTRHGFDPCAVLWVAEDPGHDPADPDLDPALVEGLTAAASYTLCTFGPYPDVPDRLRYLICEPVPRDWVEDELLRGDLDDGGANPPPDPALPARMAALVRGPAGDFLRALGLLTVPATLDNTASDAAGDQGVGDGRY